MVCYLYCIWLHARPITAVHRSICVKFVIELAIVGELDVRRIVIDVCPKEIGMREWTGFI